ncbi:O-fucosyltransferase 8 isoform X1 [Nicotiana tomentosiformis]|uniref:O-fucosyltransferase 8 isoform X1 n=1 Tax=Nicotiana tomentosiformis TaxID=4098 RepID=UPI00051B6B10|nr:O-fucosyltransferase 8 isoform X1 [Nicotiana tomentosiformis]
MGKKGSPRGRRVENQELDVSFGVKEHEFRSLDMQHGGDPPLGRRLSGGDYNWDKVVLSKGLKNDSVKFTPFKGVHVGKRQMWWLHRHIRSIVFTILLMGFLFLLDSLVCFIFDPAMLQNNFSLQGSSKTKVGMIEKTEKEGPVKLHERLLNLAAASLAEREFKQESSKLWEEPYPQASSWKPCADKTSPQVVRAGKPRNITGYILISANGGLNQQRVAVCNAVAVASLLNATLVIPKFLYSNVWKDPSQFGDIYQEDYFLDMLKDEVNIIKELPPNLKLLDVEAAGSLITDADLSKEATPDEYIKKILPLLLRNRVVHFLGYGNRLGFDPLPYELQRLRCKCNFHALKFVPKIQKRGSLLVRRIRRYDFARSTLDKQLLGNLMPRVDHSAAEGPSKYLALHLRFEIDMVAYSLCEFGGGETERRELQTYRQVHFPLLLERLKESKSYSPEELRRMGKCPLTPEEAALVLAGLGFKHGTYIYLAGSDIYGGQSRMQALTTLYPNLVTKENLLSPSELAPFRNFSSQLAALDFIACATSDVFAITDSGSQLSSLVSGFRTYYGGGHAPTLRPSKKRLAAILSRNKTIGWNSFEEKIRKMIDEGQRVQVRGFGRSIYRHPRCKECMCRH